MPLLRYEQLSLERPETESILDTLLRAGVPVPHSCKAGVCGSCLMRAVEGSVPERSQEGLKDSRKSQGYFLACSCLPSGDLTVAGVGDDVRVSARIADLRPLSADVMRVDLVPDAAFDYRAGQYLTLLREDCLARSYSLASLPTDGTLELHVRRIPEGKMSGWLFDERPVNAQLHLLGPSGDCFYVPGQEDQPLLLAGTGTGLAPLFGVLRDALRHGHRGPIHLFHGAVNTQGLYHREELAALAKEHDNVQYTATVLEGEASQELPTGPIDQVILSSVPKPAGFRAFLCGDPGLVQKLKKRLFLAGMAMRDIHADAFLPSAA